MRNEFKPFGEKDIGLLSGHFRTARLRLTLIYTVILAVILLLSSGITHSAFANLLERRFRHLPARAQMVLAPNTISPQSQDVLDDLFRSLVFVNGSLLIIACMLSYGLAGITLRPIQAVYDRQKRFLSEASHELRTPLAILQMDLENELGESNVSPVLRERLQSHLEEVQRMGRLVGDLLSLSRLDEQTRAEVVLSAMSLRPIIQKVLERFQTMALEKNVTLFPLEAGEEILVRAHEDLLFQALSNVVKNAIIYNKPQGEVKVLLERKDDQVLIRIVDTGIGIAADDIQKLFDRFYRVDQSRTRQTGGSGLGLSIVQSVMHRLDGHTQVESVPGLGTAMILSLPAVRSS